MSSSGSESSSPVASVRRTGRSRRLPAKYRGLEDDTYLQELRGDQRRKVIVKCAQDGKSIIAQVHELATFEGCPAMPHELFRGASLLLDVKGKAYPVVFIDYQEDTVRKGKKGQREKEEKAEARARQDLKKQEEEQEMKRRREKLMDAKGLSENQPNASYDHDGEAASSEDDDGASGYPPKKRWRGDDNVHIREEDRRGRGEIYVMLKYVMKKLERIDGRYERMERKLEKIEGRLEKMEDKMERRVVEQVEVAKEPKTEGGEQTEEFKVGSINLMRLSAPTPYAFALSVCDVLFTKEELSSSLLFASQKSSKPALDPQRVSMLLGVLEKRFGKEGWDLKTLKAKVNQKCRDSQAKASSGSTVV